MRRFGRWALLTCGPERLVQSRPEPIRAMKRLLILLFFVLTLAVTAEPPREKFGKIALDQAAADVVSAIGKPAKKGERYLEGATGNTIEKWEYPSLGLVIEMAEPEDSKNQAVYRIEAKAPCKWIGWNGIGIGSSATTAQKYVSSQQMNPDNQVTISKGHCSVLWTKSWTVLSFDLVNGKVSSIWMGPGPE